ncbi:MAG: TerB family tellurite resistance protein [Thermodesulfobacteriota bacterium]|nr:TerB family tellurite resistance protein [Thermodesulfobacteriota bacterium]
MINRLKKFFQKSKEIDQANHEKDDSHDIRIATCALFLEMATIDNEFSSSEREDIISILKKEYSLTDEYVTDLIKETEKELKKRIDLWQFTNLINQNYSRDEKISIIEIIWKIVYADGILDKHEDYLIHKLAKLLRLNHKQLIDAKLKILYSD